MLSDEQLVDSLGQLKTLPSLTNQTEWESLLYSLALKIRESLDLNVILNTTVAAVRKLLDTDRVVIYRFNPDWSGQTIVESVRDSWESILGQKVEDNCIANQWEAKFKAGEVTVKADIYQNPHPCYVELLSRFQVKANLVAPLLQGEELWGLLIAHHCSDSRQWQPAEIEFIRKLAAQVAIAITTAEQLRYNRFLTDATLKIRQSLDLEAILNSVVSQARQLLATERVIIYRLAYDGSGKVIVESAASGCPSMLNEQIFEPHFAENYLQAYQEGKIQVTEDIYNSDLSQCHIDFLADHSIRANLVVPLLQGKKLWGLLCAQNCSAPRKWKNREVDLLQQLAVHLAIALRQAELYQQAQTEIGRFKSLEIQLRRVNRSVRALSECNQAVIKATSTSDLLQKVCHILVEVGGYRHAWICPEDLDLNTIGTTEGAENFCFSSEVLPTGTPFIVQNLREPSTAWGQQLLSLGCQGVISLPLLVEAKSYGQLTIGAAQTDAFDAAEVQLLSELADNVAYGLKALETRNQLKKTNETLEQKVAQRTQELETANQQLQQKVTQQKQTTVELEDFAQKLKQSNRELREFAYVASHDLQEPLRKIITFGDRLQEKYGEQLPEKGTDYVTRMQNAAHRMRALINNLLDLSQITTKAKAFVEVDLGQTVQDILSDLEVQITRTQAKVEVGKLPTIQADSNQMYRLFQNLINNALKYQHSDQSPLVKIEGKILGDQCQITVADNGIGFEEKHLERIFTIFQRLHSRHIYEGTGIGLAICRKIVERHKGSITARSVPAQGATFIVTLPVKQTSTNPKI